MSWPRQWCSTAAVFPARRPCCMRRTPGCTSVAHRPLPGRRMCSLEVGHQLQPRRQGGGAHHAHEASGKAARTEGERRDRAGAERRQADLQLPALRGRLGQPLAGDSGSLSGRQRYEHEVGGAAGRLGAWQGCRQQGTRSGSEGGDVACMPTPYGVESMHSWLLTAQAWRRL